MPPPPGSLPGPDPLPEAGEQQHPSSPGLFWEWGGRVACGDFHTSGRTLASPEATSSGGQEGQRGAVGSATRCPSFCRGGGGSIQTTLETPSSSSQSPLDTLIDSGKDRPFHLGPQRRGGTRPPSQDPKKILKSVQSSGLPKGSPISSRQPEWAPPHARGSSQKPEFTRPCTACPPTSSPHPSSLSPSLTLLHPHRPPHCSSNSPGMVLPQGL